jgi:hypothetical protein
MLFPSIQNCKPAMIFKSDGNFQVSDKKYQISCRERGDLPVTTPGSSTKEFLKFLIGHHLLIEKLKFLEHRLKPKISDYPKII